MVRAELRPSCDPSLAQSFASSMFTPGAKVDETQNVKAMHVNLGPTLQGK
jgi:hypothetical protein